jgi:hypothetical protein
MATIAYRDPDLWSDMTPADIWNTYRQSRDQLLNDLFRSGRPATAFSIKEIKNSESAQNRTGI